MNTLSERISLLLEQVGNSPTRMAEIAGVKPPSVSDWVNGKTKNLKTAPALRLAKHFKVNLLWLTEGAGPMVIAPSSDTQPASDEAKCEKHVIRPEHQRLIDAYEAADKKTREVMMWVADRALAQDRAPSAAIETADFAPSPVAANPNIPALKD